MSIHISDQRLKGKWALGKSFVYIGIFITLKRMGWYFVQAVITNSICTFFNLEESINLGKFLKSDQFQSSRLTSVAIQFHRLIYKTLIGLIMTTDLEFVKKFTRPYFRPQEFYTLKTRTSRLFSPATNSKNASLSAIWPSFG